MFSTHANRGGSARDALTSLDPLWDELLPVSAALRQVLLGQPGSAGGFDDVLSSFLSKHFGLSAGPGCYKSADPKAYFGRGRSSSQSY